MILQTAIQYEPLKRRISCDEGIFCLGSCFAAEIGAILEDARFDVRVNPFGVLYNPASIACSIGRLDSGEPFTMQDVVCSQGRFCSFWHHSSFDRSTAEEFLEHANRSLDQDCRRWKEAKWVLVSFGTAWVFRHIGRDVIVSNCHRIVPQEFRRERLDVAQCEELLRPVVEAHPEKNWIFTVSPIRHLKDGLHGNQISKSTLLLAVENLQETLDNAFYFPAYEIVNDELRDYRFYEEDMTHPTRQTVGYIWEHFTNFAIDRREMERISEQLRLRRKEVHRPITR